MLSERTSWSKEYISPWIYRTIKNLYIFAYFLITRISTNILFPFNNTISLVIRMPDSLWKLSKFFDPPLTLLRGPFDLFFVLYCLFWFIRYSPHWYVVVVICDFIKKYSPKVNTNCLIQIPMQVGPRCGLGGCSWQPMQQSTGRGSPVGVEVDIGYPREKVGGGRTFLLQAVYLVGLSEKFENNSCRVF